MLTNGTFVMMYLLGSMYYMYLPRTTDTQWRHKWKKYEILGRCGRQNMLRPYLKIWEWEWIFGCAVKAISSLGVCIPWYSGCGLSKGATVFDETIEKYPWKDEIRDTLTLLTFALLYAVWFSDRKSYPQFQKF